MNPPTMKRDDTSARPSSGPVSRTVRVLLAGLMGWLAVEWATAGIDWFGRSSTQRNGWVWGLALLAVYYGLYQFPSAAFGSRSVRRTLMASGIVFAAAAGTATAIHGGVWEPPFTWLLYGFEVGFLVVVTVAHVVAVMLGTAGCEMGGLAELVHRLRGTPRPAGEPMSCIAGLHRLDQWEADQPWHGDPT